MPRREQDSRRIKRNDDSSSSQGDSSSSDSDSSGRGKSRSSKISKSSSTGRKPRTESSHKSLKGRESRDYSQKEMSHSSHRRDKEHQDGTGSKLDLSRSNSGKYRSDEGRTSSYDRVDNRERDWDRGGARRDIRRDDSGRKRDKSEDYKEQQGRSSREKKETERSPRNYKTRHEPRDSSKHSQDRDRSREKGEKAGDSRVKESHVKRDGSRERRSGDKRTEPSSSNLENRKSSGQKHKGDSDIREIKSKDKIAGGRSKPGHSDFSKESREKLPKAKKIRKQSSSTEQDSSSNSDSSDDDREDSSKAAFSKKSPILSSVGKAERKVYISGQRKVESAGGPEKTERVMKSKPGGAFQEPKRTSSSPKQSHRLKSSNQSHSDSDSSSQDSSADEKVTKDSLPQLGKAFRKDSGDEGTGYRTRDKHRGDTNNTTEREYLKEDPIITEEKQGGTPEKAHHLKGSENISEDEEIKSEEDTPEKEEGELSEDEEEEVMVKPLIAISEDMSDISSDEGITSMKEVDPSPTVVKPLPPINTPTLLLAPAPANDTNLSSKNKTSTKEKDKNPSKKMTGKIDKKKKEDLGDMSLASDPPKDRAIVGQEGQKKNAVISKDLEIDEKEDNSKRERPILESESESEEEGKAVLKSQVQGRQKMGSSISVVGKSAKERRSTSRDRLGREDRGGDQRRDRRDYGREERRRRDDRERRDRKNRDEERPRGRGDEGTREEESSNRSKPHRADGDDETAKAKENETKKKEAPKLVDGIDITTKAGGAYIPPAKLRLMQEQITDKTSVAYQRISWEALKKSINGLINKVTVANLTIIVRELFQENIVRGRGLLAGSVIRAQAASPNFTRVYAALVAIINTKFPQNGELILRRLVLMFRRGFRRNNNALCISSTQFIAHLINQQVAHEVLALEILTLLLETPTNDSVEVSIGFLKECGQKLTEVTPKGMMSVCDRLRNILHEGSVDARVQYAVEVFFAIRKDGFKDHQAVETELDLVEEDEQFTHLLQLNDAAAGDEILNVFKEDPDFAENEEKYKTLKKEILYDGSSDEESGESSGSGTSDSDDDDEEEEKEKQKILDQTETNLVALRRTIYLTVKSSLDHNECAHKILKMGVKPGQESELCNMILDCCAQLRTYEKFFGLLAQKFCQLDKKYLQPFQQIFCEQYETIHRLETNKLRNVGKFFAHLLFTDAISWGVLSVVKLTEEDTTSASRIFLKILFQELSEYMGLHKLNERLKDQTLSSFFSGIMPRDNPKNTRFSINFFTTIGLGGLTDDLREHLKAVTKQIVQQKQDEEIAKAAAAGKAAAANEDSSSDSSDSDSSSEPDSSDDARRKKKKKSSVKVRKSDQRSRKKKDGGERRKSGSCDERQRSAEKRNASSGKRSQSQKGDNAINGKGAPSRPGIAARLLDMAEYGDVNLREVGEVHRDTGRDRHDMENSRERGDGKNKKGGDVRGDRIRGGEMKRGRSREENEWSDRRRMEDSRGRGGAGDDGGPGRNEDLRGRKEGRARASDYFSEERRRDDRSYNQDQDRRGGQGDRSSGRSDKRKTNDNPRGDKETSRRRDERKYSSSEDSDSSQESHHGTNKGRQPSWSSGRNKENRKRPQASGDFFEKSPTKKRREIRKDRDSSSESSDDSSDGNKRTARSKVSSSKPMVKKRKRSVSSGESDSSSSSSFSSSSNASSSSVKEKLRERRGAEKKLPKQAKGSRDSRRPRRETSAGHGDRKRRSR